MTFTHQQAAQGNQGRGAKTKFLRTEQSSDNNIPSGFKTAVHLHPDPITQAVPDQYLLCFGQADFPAGPGMLDRR